MATRGNDAASDPLAGSIDRLADAFDRLGERLEHAANGGGAFANDPFSRHVQRFFPFYALLSIWVLLLVLLPNRNDGSDNVEQAAQVTSAQTAPLGDATDVTVPDDTTGAPTAPGPGGVAPATTASDTEVAGTVATPPPADGALDPLAWTATGKTAGGFDCKQGVRQIPWSAYAAPCYPKWTGTNNGGATYRGVTAKEITIVRRVFPDSANSEAAEQIAQQAGAASEEVVDKIRAEYIKYFNKVFETWGRKVNVIEWESQFGDSTAEAQSQGREGACADANVIVNEVKAFAVMDAGDQFSECAAERKLIVFNAAAYFPESWYKKHHPWAWHGVMDCERISTQLAEYIGKRLAPFPAKWAKGLDQGKPRRFGVYVPNNDEYQYCTNVTERDLKAKYNVTPASRYNYTLDLARFPDEAAKGIIQFKADGVTTVVLACDPFSPIFLTQAAKGQSYFPEWFEIGTALNDVDNVPRLWDAEEIRGSLFGLSQLGATEKILGPEGEAPKTYKTATGTTIPAGTSGDYFGYLTLFSVIQGAGPNLTPETVARSYFRQPPGGAPRFEVGYVSYQDGPDGKKGATDHTGIDDSREIYWDHTANGYDGKVGAYKETMGGKRFRNGEWPRGEPAFTFPS